MELPPIDQVEIAFQAYRELQAELRGEAPPKEVPAPEAPPSPENETPVSPPDRPDLNQALEEIGPLPPGAIFLGLADDGSPLLHDLFPPGEQQAAAGPLLIVGDARSGKTALLQTLAAGLDAGDEPGDILFGVLTPRLAEWEAFEAHPSSLGIWPTRPPLMARLLGQLCAWAEASRHHRAGVILLIDGLEWLANATPEIRRDLRYLLLYGPSRRIWPAATVEAAQAGELRAWLDYFSSRIYARVASRPLAEFLTDDPAAALDDLMPGEYLLELPDGWLKFWIPALNPERRLP